MIKKILLCIQVFCLLTCLPGETFSEEFRLNPGQKFFPPEVVERLAEALPENKSVLIDLKALMTAYPGFCLGVELGKGRELYLIMKNGAKIIYDDGQIKDFEKKLATPDLKDSLDQLYHPGVEKEPFQPDYDPGRFRVNAFFNAVYGGSAKEVRSNLVLVSFCGAKVMFNKQNGAAKALENVGRELETLLSKRPQLRQYVFPLGGTYNWRWIAGTDRLSPHSWGIAIDLNPRYGAYWQGKNTEGGESILKMRDKYPVEIVELFEKNGFIWGGKWSHFDLMHFEYRPELLEKWQLTKENAVK